MPLLATHAGTLPRPQPVVDFLFAREKGQAPHRIERLALLDTNPRAETAPAQTNRARQIARALSGDLAGVLRDEMKPDYLAPGPQRDHILDLCRSLPASPPRCATGRTNAPHSPASRVPLSC